MNVEFLAQHQIPLGLKVLVPNSIYGMVSWNLTSPLQHCDITATSTQGQTGQPSHLSDSCGKEPLIIYEIEMTSLTPMMRKRLVNQDASILNLLNGLINGLQFKHWKNVFWYDNHRTLTCYFRQFYLRDFLSNTDMPAFGYLRIGIYWNW